MTKNDILLGLFFNKGTITLEPGCQVELSLKPFKNISDIEKEFAKGSFMKLGESSMAQNVEVIHSGSIMLDEALGVGGYPKGRIIEIYGPESSGKTTLALKLMEQGAHLISDDISSIYLKNNSQKKLRLFHLDNVFSGR